MSLLIYRWQKYQFYYNPNDLATAYDEGFMNHLQFGNESFAIHMIRISPKIFFKGILKNTPLDVLDSITRLLDNRLALTGFGWEVKIEKYFLYEQIDEFLLLIQQHGLLKHIENENKFMSKNEVEDPRRVLTMHMLSAGWYLWLGGLCVAFIAFIGEHIPRFISRIGSKSRNKLVRRKCINVKNLRELKAYVRKNSNWI